MKKLVVTTFATALLTGCGAQPTQESASKTSVEPREPANPSSTPKFGTLPCYP